ncbi:MAG: sporulation protein YqfD [Ruminococcus sp.]|nr:sporulation protein YqfD [Candidatus Copronaster equi]
MIFKLIRIIFGVVSLKAENGFSERFINFCTSKGIPLWNISKNGSCIYADTTISGYKKIRTPARKSGMRVRITKKSGLPFFLHRHKDKSGLVAGFIIFFAGLIFLSGRVWTINITGNQPVNSQKIEEVFYDSGLKIGIRTKALDNKKIISDALGKLDEISWASINIRGCTANIEVRKSVTKPDIKINPTLLSNIVAKKDGQIEIVEAYHGKQSVVEGQTVMKGSLLISGISQNKSYVNTYSPAEGYVVAKTNLSVKSETKFSEYVLIPETKKYYSPVIFGKELSAKNKDKYDICYLVKSKCILNGVALPFGINCRTYTKFVKEKTKYNEARLKLEALNSYALESYNQTLHTQIESADISIKKLQNKFAVYGDYSVYENIGVQQTFEIEEISLPEK